MLSGAKISADLIDFSGFHGFLGRYSAIIMRFFDKIINRFDSNRIIT
jgi:hypothetical protein